MSNLQKLQSLFLLVASLLTTPQALAHKASDAYARISGNADGLQVQLSVALQDLDATLPSLDANEDRELTWGEVKAAVPAVQTLLTQRVQAQCSDQIQDTTWVYEALESRSDGVYLRARTRMACAGAQNLALRYTLMDGIDPTHRLLVSGNAGGQSMAKVLSSTKPMLMLTSATAAETPAKVAEPATSATMVSQSGWDVFASFFPEGIHHIATGYDHLAFLLALLLPLRFWPGALQSAGATTTANGQRGLRSLVLTVTAFTLGHSITLVLATLGAGESPNWVEPVIAISIGIAAWLNLYPRPRLHAPALALGFGLIHGLGFAGIMREAQVEGAHLGWALAGFNLGVEAGQLVGVALWCIVSSVIARWQHYERVVVRGGSWALMGVATFWTIERLAG